MYISFVPTPALPFVVVHNRAQSEEMCHVYQKTLNGLVGFSCELEKNKTSIMLATISFLFSVKLSAIYVDICSVLV